MRDPETLLSAATLTPRAFAAEHDAILRGGRELAESLYTRPQAPQLGHVVAWLAQLTIDARLDPLLGYRGPGLQTASAWTIDAVLAAEDSAHAPAARAAAAQLARRRLADSLEHPHGAPLSAMVRRSAHALALALDAHHAPARRRDALISLYAELLALAVARRRRLPRAPAVPPKGHAPRPAPWTIRGAAAHALRAVTPQQHRRALRQGRAAAADAPARRGHIAAIVATLPDLTHDALALAIGGGCLGPRAERAWLARVAARAAAALWHAEQALAPEHRHDPDRLFYARLRLESIADTDVDVDTDVDDPVLATTHDCADYLSVFVIADVDDPSIELGLAAAELLAIVLLAWTPQHAGWLGRASARPQHRHPRARPA